MNYILGIAEKEEIPKIFNSSCDGNRIGEIL